MAAALLKNYVKALKRNGGQRLCLQIHHGQNVGGPELIYHPTDLLLEGEVIISIPFTSLSKKCTHRDGQGV
jgi:hypothetical protein